MLSITIRKINLADLDMLQQISRETFQETFAASNTEENMNSYLSENLSTDKLRHELNNPDSLFYFAIHDTNVIGYLKINKGAAQSEKISDRSIEIERIYALASYHGRGVGQRLLEFAINKARDLNAAQIWLGVWEENHRAIAFYRKNGFIEFDRHEFRLGDDIQTDIMMKIDLQHHPVDTRLSKI
jgi:ribosomal protein S18 acetylase RimI-like enzyme